MDTERFDAVVTSLAHGLTRRRGLGLLAAVGAATFAGQHASDDTAAKGKGKGKKRRKHKPKKVCRGGCAACQTCSGRTCVPVADGAVCGSGTCVGGQCITCPSGFELVKGICARRCATSPDCGPNGLCTTLVEDAGLPVGTARRICIRPEDGTYIRYPCASTSSGYTCPAGEICVSATGGPQCGQPV
ncbi:MAG: hypothetical protein QM692_12415 [Thermomicrobiales bacterium]